MAAVVIAVESVKVKSASARRFHVVKIVRARESREVLHLSVEKRSDSLPVARKAAEASFRSEAQIISRRVFDSVLREFV